MTPRAHVNLGVRKKYEVVMNKELGLSGLRESGNEVEWFLEFEDEGNEVYLQLNCMNLDPRFRTTNDITETRLVLNSENSELYEQYFSVEETEMQLQKVDLSIKRVSADMFSIKYFVEAGESVVDVYKGIVNVRDKGLTFLAEKKSEIERILKDDYPDRKYEVKWCKSGWGNMAEVKFF